MSKRGDPIPDDLAATLNGHGLETFTAADLLSEVLPDVRFAVPDILPAGLAVFAGRPKHGKTWLTLELAVAVSTGGYALGTKRVEQGECLVLALEDNKRRLQNRLRKLLHGDDAPSALHIATSWPRADEGGIEALSNWFTDHPDCRLVVIDTLARFKPRSEGRRSQYDEDRDAVDPLIPLAAEHNVAIVLVHHLREGEAEDPLDMIHGSAGLTGGVDNALVLKRRRGQADAYLHVDGRDIEDAMELALKWNVAAATWAIVGDADEYRMSEGRRAIIGVLADADEPIGPRDITELVNTRGHDIKYGAIRELLSQMVKDGQVKNLGRGRYVDPHKHADNTDKLTNEGDAPWERLDI